MGGTPEWTNIIPLIGALTMLTGSYLAITQIDIKLILAYTTISALGILVLLFGIDTHLSVKAALVFLFVHAFYKAALFMVAGYIDKKTHTRDIDKLGGIIKYTPIGFVVVLIAALSMAGLPPLLGFIGKELIYEAKIQLPGISSLILILGVSSNILMVTISLFFIYKIFLGKHVAYENSFSKDQLLFLFGPGVLAVLSLGLGVFPNLLSVLIKPALSTIGFQNNAIKLKLWHGLNDVFLLSVFTVLTGSLIFFLLKKEILKISRWRLLNNRLFGITFSEVFTNVLNWLVWLSARNTRLIQHGYHRYYLLTVIVFSSVLLWFQFYYTRGWSLNTTLSVKPFYITGIVVVSAIAIFYSVTSKYIMATIIAMSVIGYGVSLIYLYYSAVDLAITQIIVETLIVVMFVLVVQKVPRFVPLSSKLTRLRDAIVALVFGAVMTGLTLKAINVEFNHPISDYYIANSFSKAYGNNVVNVILVDFRSLDTLGEVTVLTIAAIGVSVLLKQKKTNQSK
jgi:multicomponent Na+:H+ antiporter subunit A